MTFYLLCLIILGTFSPGLSFNQELWKNASVYLKERLDNGIDPCVSFYDYTCGKLDKNMNRLSNPSAYAIGELNEAIKSIDKTNPRSTKFAKNVKQFYDFCLSEANDDQKIRNDLLEALVKILKIDETRKPNFENSDVFWAWQSHVHKVLGQGLFLVFNPYDLLLENGSKDQSVLIDTRKDLYPKKPLNLTDFQERYFLIKLMAALDSHRKPDFKLAEKTANDVFHFEEALMAHLNLESKKAYTAPLKIHGFKNLLQTYKKIPWFSSYFKNLLGKQLLNDWKHDSAVFIVWDTSIRNLDSFLKTSKSLVKNKIAAYYFVTKLYMHLRNNEMNLKGTYRNSVNKYCAHKAAEHFPSAAARLLFDYKKWDFSAWKTDVELISHNVMSAFKIFTSNSKWLSRSEKLYVIRKINFYHLSSIIPKWIANDTAVSERTDAIKLNENFFEYILLHTDEYRTFMSKLRIMVYGSAEYDPEPSMEYNAYHHFNLLHIEVKLGFVTFPLYHPDLPLALKYGYLGAVVGHEIMHGFDSDNVQYEKDFNRFTLFEEHKQKEFEKAKTCLIEQLKEQCVDHGENCVDGNLTLAETMSDLDGLKIAYMAYLFARQTSGKEENIPGFGQYSNDQLFFLAYARSSCSNYQHHVDILEIKDPHAPGKVRVDTSVKNFRVFGVHFNCSLGKPMAPYEPCSFWGNFFPRNPKGLYKF